MAAQCLTSNIIMLMKNWHNLTDIAQVDELATNAEVSTCVIFKHSTRCNISEIALTRLREADLSQFPDIPFYYLDLLAHREVSDYVSEKFQVHHESPQLLLIEKGECIYDVSHLDIYPAALQEVFQP